MRKNKKHKWKYRINVKKKILVLVILGVFLFVGLGYAILEANLGMFGTLEVASYDKTLYGVFLKESKLGYAQKYTGNHQDSMDSTKSTEDIYHFYSENIDSEGRKVRDKFNVVFADKCWQMIRTTDTGGVKLLYNGIPETTIVDGETQYDCGDTRTVYQMGEIATTTGLSGSKTYAKNYTAKDLSNGTGFTLVDDPNDPDDTYTVNITNANAATEIAYIAENYPYTCGSTSIGCRENSFYKIISQSSGTTANVYKASYRGGIGVSKYGPNYNSPAYVGYKYGDVYTMQGNLVGTTTVDYAASKTILTSSSFLPTYHYSKTLNLTGTYTVYELDNPILGSDIPESTYAGYYAYRSTTTVSGNSPHYLVARNGTGNNYYNVQLSATKDLAAFTMHVGTDLVDNGNNTYTIKNGTNQATEVTPTDWFNNYASYVGKYTCEGNTDTCQTPRYITKTTVTNYTYVPVEYITIAKSRNGLALDDYITIGRDTWYNNYTTYSAYKYTCGDASTTCTESNLRYIPYYTSTGYTYAPNRYFGKSVKYENGVYKLQDVVGLETAKDLTALSTHHYTCTDIGVKECAQVAYVFYYPGDSNTVNTMNYIILNDPNVESIEEALEGMLKKNTTDSEIKKVIDKWYEANLLNTSYESKVDDTIYCNDRSYSTATNKTFAQSGWNPNGGSTKNYLYFKENVASEDLSCTNIEDRFSVSNNKAQLTYKIGLMSVPEMNLLNQNSARSQLRDSFLSSSSYFSNQMAYVGSMHWGGGVTNNPKDVNDSAVLVRPAISLVAGTRYSRGTGEMTNPYIVDMSQ